MPNLPESSWEKSQISAINRDRSSSKKVSGLGRVVQAAALSSLLAAGCTDKPGNMENIGNAESELVTNPHAPNWGQGNGTMSPQQIRLDASNWYNVFSRWDTDNYQIKIQTTSDGGANWTPETNIDDSLSAIKIADSLTNEFSITICPPSSTCDGKGFVVTDRNGIEEIMQFDWNHNVKQASNVSFLPSPINDGLNGAFKVGLNADGSLLLYSSILSAKTKLYTTSSTNPTTELLVQGQLDVDHSKTAVWGNHLITGTNSGCGNLGLADMCHYDIVTPGDAVTPMVIANPTNLNSMPGAGVINNANSQGDASVTNVSPRKLHYIELGKVKEADITEAALVCGDNIKNGSEACDGTDLGGQTCGSLGFQVGPQLACNTGCNFDTSACVPLASCGDGVKNGAEQCDTNDLAGQSCGTLGFTPGAGLDCDGTCHFDTSACTPLPVCGDGVKNGSEQCDGNDHGGQDCVSLGFVSGTLGCNACTFNTTNCVGGAGGNGGAGGVGGAGGETPGGMGGVPNGGNSAGGEVVGGGGAGAGGNGAGGEVVGGAGAGGNGPDCPVTVTGAVNLQSCDANGAVISAAGIGTAKFGDKTFTVNEVVKPCSFSITMPNKFDLISGNCGTKLSEPPDTIHRYFDGEYGDTLGAEGSEKETVIPNEFNPGKGNGEVIIIGYKANKATHMVWDAQGCEPDNLPDCQPRDFLVPGATEEGQLPEGSVVYKRLSDGKFSANGAELLDTPPGNTPGETGDEGGCSIANVDDGRSSTRGNLAPILMTLGLAAVLARRKKHTGVEVKKA